MISLLIEEHDYVPVPAYVSIRPPNRYAPSCAVQDAHNDSAASRLLWTRKITQAFQRNDMFLVAYNYLLHSCPAPLAPASGKVPLWTPQQQASIFLSSSGSSANKGRLPRSILRNDLHSSTLRNFFLTNTQARIARLACNVLFGSLAVRIFRKAPSLCSEDTFPLRCSAVQLLNATLLEDKDSSADQCTFEEVESHWCMIGKASVQLQCPDISLKDVTSTQSNSTCNKNHQGLGEPSINHLNEILLRNRGSKRAVV